VAVSLTLFGEARKLSPNSLQTMIDLGNIFISLFLYFFIFSHTPVSSRFAVAQTGHESTKHMGTSAEHTVFESEVTGAILALDIIASTPRLCDVDIFLFFIFIFYFLGR
jgi:hypothetical protein